MNSKKGAKKDMKYKKLVKIVLLGFVIASFGYLVFNYATRPENDERSSPVSNPQPTDSSLLNSRSQTDSNRDLISQCATNGPGCENAVLPRNYVIAYYFYGTHRCWTCITIERYAREAIESGFAKEIQEGRIKFLPINVEQAENRHFIKDYSLYTRSLILARFEDGREVGWKNLEKVWAYVRNKDAFIKYVQAELREALK